MAQNCVERYVYSEEVLRIFLTNSILPDDIMLVNPNHRISKSGKSFQKDRAIVVLVFRRQKRTDVGDASRPPSQRVLASE